MSTRSPQSVGERSREQALREKRALKRAKKGVPATKRHYADATRCETSETGAVPDAG